MELFTLGIDLGKTTFHLVGMNRGGEVVLRKRFSRVQLLHFTANLKVKLIGMEACGGSHFLGRALREQGHDVRLIPAQYVKPYVKTNKSDYIDAEAIAEAVRRPTMRFVPVKSDDQLDGVDPLIETGKMGTDYVWLLSSLQQQDSARSWLRPAKRTWALLESNPRRNNRLKTHRNDGRQGGGAVCSASLGSIGLIDLLMP